MSNGFYDQHGNWIPQAAPVPAGYEGTVCPSCGKIARCREGGHDTDCEWGRKS